MTILHALFLGLVEGITEFLPISSTGHLILTSELLGLSQGEFVKSFEIIIQLGAIFAVITLYWRRLLTDFETIKRLAVAFLPTAILGLLFYKIVKVYLLGNSMVVVWSLILGGIFLILFEKFFQEKNHAIKEVTDIPYLKAFLIGLFQTFAFIPGVSRAGATIIGGLALNITRTAIVEMSFFLAVPTMVAATGLDLVKNFDAFQGDQLIALSIGFVTSFFTALLAIKFLLRFIQKHSFIGFGVYRILIGFLFLLFI